MTKITFLKTTKHTKVAKEMKNLGLVQIEVTVSLFFYARSFSRLGSIRMTNHR